MNKIFSTARTGHLYRVDKSIVSERARSEFLGRVRTTHELLSKQPGCVRDLLLEQVAGPGGFNIVTLVEWENEKAIELAREAVIALHRTTRILVRMLVDHVFRVSPSSPIDWP